MAPLQIGPKTHCISRTLFRKNREKLCAALKTQPKIDASAAYVLLAGGKEVHFNDTDVSVAPFRQESFFQYLFGVKEPDCYGVINVQSGETTLFVPRLPQEYEAWMGHLHTLEEFRAMYEVQQVQYACDMPTWFEKANPKLLLTLSGTNSDSGLTSEPARFTGIEKYTVDSTVLHPVLAECRVIKTAEEIEVLRYVAKVSSEAHIKVMQSIKPGNTEYQGESIFLQHCYGEGGCRHVSYTCICGSGTNSAVLHYGHAGAPNDEVIMDGDMCLFDMGANYCGYAADITCSFPANGKFTQDQRFIYNAVLAARNAVLAQARAGVSWVDMHKLSAKVMLQCLVDGGMLKGDVNEMLQTNLPVIFQPHGLGHLIGLDVHDVGGYLPGQPERPKEEWLQKLRFARVLEENMYVTVEPGCYFVGYLMDRALKDPNLRRFINVEVFERFRNFGGVRIEDDVWIKKDGNENFALVPRTVEEIEAVMAKGQ